MVSAGVFGFAVGYRNTRGSGSSTDCSLQLSAQSRSPTSVSAGTFSNCEAGGQMPVWPVQQCVCGVVALIPRLCGVTRHRVKHFGLRLHGESEMSLGC